LKKSEGYTKEEHSRIISAILGCWQTIDGKLPLFGGAIRLAGTVKARKSGNKTPASDWMEIEKQRGISVPSVMQFD